MASTYSAPSEKTIVSVIFCWIVILSPQTTGIGSSKITMSSTKDNAAEVWKSFVCPAMQCPSIRVS